MGQTQPVYRPTNVPYTNFHMRGSVYPTNQKKVPYFSRISLGNQIFIPPINALESSLEGI